MKLNDSKQVVFNLNTRTKSHVHAIENADGSLTLRLRYDEVRTAETFDDLLDVANYSRHGRDFMDDAWVTLLKKNGYDLND